MIKDNKDDISNKSNPELDNILKCNSEILKILMTNNLRNALDDIKQVISSKVFQQKIKLLFKFYKPRGNEDSSFMERRRICNKFQVTETIKKLVTSIADNLNLNLEQSFDLVDIYFQSNRDKLDRLYKKEEFIRILDQSDQANIRHFTETNIYEFRHKFEYFKHTVQEEVIRFHYGERINLLKLAYIFVSISFNEQDPVSRDFREIFNELNKNDEWVKNLWATYKMYTHDYRICKDLVDIAAKDKHSLQIMKEQIDILDIYMLLCIKLTSGVFKDLFVDMFDTFCNQKFMGYYKEVVNEHHVEEVYHEQEKNVWIIIDLCVLLVLHNMDLKYFVYYDNKYKGQHAYDVDHLDTTKLPFNLLRTRDQVNKIFTFFEKDIHQNFAKPIFMAFSSIIEFIDFQIQQNPSEVDETMKENFKNIQKDKWAILEDICNREGPLEFMNNMFSRLIYSRDRHAFHDFYNFTIKFWLNVVIKYYFKYSHSPPLIDLCVKTLNSEITKIIFWNVDYTNGTPIGVLFETLIDDFPNNFDMMLMFCHAVKGSKRAKFFSTSLFDRLMDMKFFNMQCAIGDLELVSENRDEVRLTQKRKTRIGLTIPAGTVGVITKSFQESRIQGQIENVKFNYHFSLFQLLYIRWTSLIHSLSEISATVNMPISEMLQNYEESINIKLVQLFCSLIADNNNLLDIFFNANLQDAHYMMERDFNDQLTLLLSFCFETISLISKNWQLYTYLFPLSNSIYSMIESFLHNPKMSQNFVSVVITNFINSFEGVSKSKDFGYSYTPHSIYSQRRNQPDLYNLIEIFGNTLNFDFHRKSYENTIIVLKIIKKFFKYPNILEFVKNINSTEFLFNIWSTLIVELIRSMMTTETLAIREEFEVCKELVKIVSCNFRIITYSSREKSSIISVNPNTQNTLFELVLACLNSIDTHEFITKVLKTRVIIDENEMNLKDKLSLRNIFWNSFINEGNNYYLDKKTAQNLLRVAFKCLNQIYDIVIYYKMTNDETIQKLYSKIDTVKQLEEVFFISKIIPSYDTKVQMTNETYSINLILSIFSYIDFEDREMLDYQLSKGVYFSSEAANEFELRKQQEEEMERLSKGLTPQELVNFQRQGEKDFNICTLSLSCLNKILTLLKLQSTSANVGIGGLNIQTQTSNIVTKASNLLTYLSLRKETSSEMENTINLFDKFRDTLCILLLKPSEFSFKIEIIKFLIQCANSQIGFLTLFLEEIKIKALKTKKFWEIFKFLVNVKPEERENPIQYRSYNEMMGYLTIFISTVFSSDTIFKKMIKDFLTSFKDSFDKFLNYIVNIYSLAEKESYLRDCRELFKKNRMEINNEWGAFLLAEDDIRKSCFENTVVKSLSIIFAKLIIISEESDSMSRAIKFSYAKDLSKFLNNSISNFIDLYSGDLGYEFINHFNFKLTDEGSFNTGYNMGEESMAMGVMSNRSKTKNYNFYSDYNIKENVIYIKNSEKVISNSLENYFAPFIGGGGFSLNHWIDLKELYITMKLRNYSMDIFLEYLSRFIEYNLELSLFESKTQTMYSVCYLLGLIFSVGSGSAFMSTYLFTNHKTYKTINHSSFTRDFASYYLDMYKGDFPKMGFKFISEGIYSLSDFVKFAEDRVIKKLQMAINFYNKRGEEIKKERNALNMTNINDFNFYNQYIATKWDILNYIVDHLIYLYNDREDKNVNFPVTIFQKHFMRFILDLEKDFPLFVNNSEQAENSILSMLNLMYSLLTYLITTEYEFAENEIQAINSFINSLLICFDKIPSYQAIIIFILNAYASINFFTNSPNSQFESLNLIFNSEDHKIIKMLMKKLSIGHSEQEYLAIVSLLITLVDNYEETLELIIKEKILLIFQLNDKFSDIISINEYQDNERSVNHILWCWTLIFFRQVCMKLLAFEESEELIKRDHMKYYSIFYSIVDFLINHEARILHILSDTNYIDQSGNHIHKSLAFLEEMEYIVSLLNVLFLQSKKWKNTSLIHFDFHNRFITIILSKTLKLYIPNIKISNHYKFFSNIEKTMSELYPGEVSKEDKIQLRSTTTPQNISLKDDHYTSFYSPMRKNLRGLGGTMDKPPTTLPTSPRRDFSRGNISYNPRASSLFFYRVDNCLNKILYNLTNIIKSATVFETFSTKTSYANYIRESYTRGSSTFGTSQNIRVFDEQCQNLIFALYFAYHSLESMIKNFDNIEKLYEISNIFFGNINASVNFGNLNLVYFEGHFEDIFQINNATLQNLLLINSTFYQFISYFRSTLSYSFENQLKDITMRKLDHIIKSMKERDNKVEGFKDFSYVYDSITDFVKRNMDTLS